MQPENLPLASTGWRPAFMREIRERAEAVGLISATHELLARNHIGLAVDGDFAALQHHPDGILFVGDHKSQWEFVAIMGLLHRMGRHEMSSVAKFYVRRQAVQALGQLANDYVLPVYPRVLAKDRPLDWNSELINRWLYRRSLLTFAESRRMNHRVIDLASQRLAAGGVINIFPCGSVGDAKRRPWRAGVGEIMLALPEWARERVVVATYRMQDISKLRLLGAVMARGRGVLGRPQTMTIELCPLQSVAELMQDVSAELRTDATAVTAVLRHRFLEHFASDA